VPAATPGWLRQLTPQAPQFTGDADVSTQLSLQHVSLAPQASHGPLVSGVSWGSMSRVSGAVSGVVSPSGVTSPGGMSFTRSVVSVPVSPSMPITQVLDTHCWPEGQSSSSPQPPPAASSEQLAASNNKNRAATQGKTPARTCASVSGTRACKKVNGARACESVIGVDWDMRPRRNDHDDMGVASGELRLRSL